MSLSLSNGEIHFLWWFIQGSIMSPATRERLWRGWGMCDRHSWAFLAIEAAFRGGYLLGPAVLYEDLMGRAERIVTSRGVAGARGLARRLRERGPCLMCADGFGPHSRGAAREDMVQTGRDPAALIGFARETESHWRRAVCGRCAASDSPRRCRRHLIEELAGGLRVELSREREFVQELSRRLRAFLDSFRFDHRGDAAPEERAALIAAVGWCCGFRPLLSLLGLPR